jgi:hypothetical protein
VDDSNLIRKLDDFNSNGQIGMYVSERIKLEKGELIYSNVIEDTYWNYISNLDVESKEEFANLWDKYRKVMIEKNRVPCINVLPTSKLYEKIQEYLGDKFLNFANNLWMVFDKNFIYERKELNKEYSIEITNDKRAFADVMLKGFNTNDPGEPYSNTPSYYRYGIYNSFESNNEYKKYHYLVRHNGYPVSIATAIVRDGMVCLDNVTTIKEYRNKGICRALITRILDDFKDKEIIFLQTEKGSYLEKFYNSLGFREAFVCKSYCEQI